jgi:hypothetical protein
MTTWIRKLEQGITGGALATVPMSAVMVGAQRLGLLGKHPPEKITQAMLFGIGARPSRGQRKLLAVAAHFGFGAATGAVFSLARPGEPTLLRAALEGAAFGTAVWATSYIGLVPKLGIMPRPARDRPGRAPSMIVAHVVFGAALGMIVAARRRRGEARRAAEEPVRPGVETVTPAGAIDHPEPVHVG